VTGADNAVYSAITLFLAPCGAGHQSSSRAHRHGRSVDSIAKQVAEAHTLWVRCGSFISSSTDSSLASSPMRTQHTSRLGHYWCTSCDVTSVNKVVVQKRVTYPRHHRQRHRCPHPMAAMWFENFTESPELKGRAGFEQMMTDLLWRVRTTASQAGGG
jgi:hypothetical protein